MLEKGSALSALLRLDLRLATSCNVLQRLATSCNVLQRLATVCLGCLPSCCICLLAFLLAHWILPRGRRHSLHGIMAVLLGKAGIMGLVEGCLPRNVGSRSWILPRGTGRRQKIVQTEKPHGHISNILVKKCVVKKYESSKSIHKLGCGCNFFIFLV